jgi:hypothetical protein
MDDDPVLYALKDRGSRLVVLTMGAVMGCAYFFDFAAIF